MEHLQRLYWSQYRGVLQTIRHGRPEQAIEVCLELLLEPQLNLYLRVLVNATIAEYASFERHPDKADFAEEAIRVSREMQEATEGEGPRAQATVQRAIFLANRSLEVVIQQTAERQARLGDEVLQNQSDAGDAWMTIDEAVTEQTQELLTDETVVPTQEADTVEDTAQSTTAVSQAAEDSTVSQNLTLLSKSRLSTSETTDAPQPPSSDM